MLRMGELRRNEREGERCPFWQVWDGCIGRRRLITRQDVLLRGVNVVQVTLCGITKGRGVCVAVHSNTAVVGLN